MKKPARRFKLVYKIILTLFLINIVPLIVVNLILNSSIDGILEETLRRSLREGRDYIKSIFDNGAQELRSQNKSLSEEKRFSQLAARLIAGARAPQEIAAVRQLMTEFNAPYLAIYRITGTTGNKRADRVFEQAFTYFSTALVKADPAFLLRGSSESSVTVSITGQGLVFFAATPLQVIAGQQEGVSFVLAVARVRELGFLNQLRVALQKDFTLVGEGRSAILSTRYNAWGESARGMKISHPAVETGFGKKTETFFQETHLDKPQAALAFPIVDPGSGQVITVGLVAQERTYSAEQQSIFLFLQLITVISVALSVVVSVFLSRGIVGPINTLIRGITRLNTQISKDEKYNPIIINTRDEILTLAKSYNTMAGELFTSHRELKEYSVNLEKMVEQRTEKLNEANARMKRDLEIARTVQLAILPKAMPVTDEYAIAAWMTPMLETSGDYYDIIEIDRETTGLLVVDVSGHGIPSALVTMMAKTSFANYAKRAELSTGAICQLVNTTIHDALGDIGFYLTAFFVKVNTRTMVMEYTNAGHHKAIRYNPETKDLQELDTEGFFIGSVDDVVYETKSIRLQQHDRVLIFTDGIVEARDHEGEFYGDKRLFDFLKKHRADSAQVFVHALLKEIQEFYKQAAPNDDRTVMVFDVFRSPDSPLDAAGASRGNEEVRRLFLQATECIRTEAYERAESLFHTIISYEPENYTAWFNLGITHYRQGHLEKALHAWEHTIAINPDFAKARENLASLKKIMQQGPSS